MNFIRLCAFILLIFSLGCEKKGNYKQSRDFNTLMGSNKSVWKFVETQEDYENLQLYKELYEKNRDLESSDLKIPKVAHFIWVGPHPFPQTSVEYVNSWITKHPDWTFKFWTDRRRPLPNKKMELKFISDFEFSDLQYQFEETDNFAEKSDLLRYEILYKEGGVYIDHDVECAKPHTPFHYTYDLYCGLEPPHAPILSSSISVNNNLIGVRPGHPVLKRAIELVKERWVEMGIAYPGTDKDSVVYRVAQRSFASFDDAVHEKVGEGSNRDIVFPAAYFNRIDGDFSLYAHHYYDSTWFSDETKFEKNVRRRLVSISKKNNQILLFNGAILTANMALFVCLMFQFRSLRKSKNHDS